MSEKEYVLHCPREGHEVGRVEALSLAEAREQNPEHYVMVLYEGWLRDYEL